uniref:Centrosomal protein of 19 kDa n=1 Tax=Ciona savignyi TaxID=51511 RepID=H2Y904_CIOSA
EMYSVKKCGVKLKPPTLVVTYEDESLHRMRCRKMPLRNFKANSNVSRTAEEMKKNARHQMLLKDVSQIQIEKMLHIVQGTLNGLTIDEAVKKAEKEMSVDPEVDLNKLDQSKVEKAKRIMDEAFEQNRVKPGDDDFQYDVEVDFGNEGAVETSGWDSNSDDIDEF